MGLLESRGYPKFFYISHKGVYVRVAEPLPRRHGRAGVSVSDYARDIGIGRGIARWGRFVFIRASGKIPRLGEDEIGGIALAVALDAVALRAPRVVDGLAPVLRPGINGQQHNQKNEEQEPNGVRTGFFHFFRHLI